MNHLSLWIQVILFNYYYRQGRWICYRSFQSSIPVLEEVLQMTNAFKLGLKINCGLGTTVKFWKHCWIGDVPLAYAFEMASNKDAWVSSQIQENDWAITFSHPCPRPDFRRWQASFALCASIQVVMALTRLFVIYACQPPLLFVLSIFCCIQCDLKIKSLHIFMESG